MGVLGQTDAKKDHGAHSLPTLNRSKCITWLFPLAPSMFPPVVPQAPGTCCLSAQELSMRALDKGQLLFFVLMGGDYA